ncbi:La-related protein 1b [Thalictrum thalictroides]|uniref:La-related protein 1b n=1 Tax=Thalictrum thalictroides TaxID=46969 RepID=A0A7J6VDM2_THATH|nr:La-related protein 1b [Thalictrum thalictroides]
MEMRKHRPLCDYRPPPTELEWMFYPFMHPDMYYRYFPDANSTFHHAHAPLLVKNYPNINRLRYEILKQIEYYFSDENLKKDAFLKNNDNMDVEGWVDIHLIAGFNRVKDLTNDIFLILEALRPSRVVEVKGEKVRKRDNWSIYILPSSSSSTETSSLENILGEEN